MILLVDNYDSFTYNLVDYFRQLGQECVIVKNNITPEETEGIIFDSVVLSPGPGIPENAGNLLKLIERYYLQKPILGICLGHQAICRYFGGQVEKAIRPMHGKISMISRKDDVIFNNTPDKYKVVRYHSLVSCRLPENLEVIAATEEGEVMAVRHKDFPIWGIQFHPEAALTEYGTQVLKNWLLATDQLN